MHILYQLLKITMNDTNPTDKPKNDRMVHASFRKVVAFDTLFFVLGVLTGIGIGVYLIAN